MPGLAGKRVRGLVAEFAVLAVLVVVALAAVKGHQKDDSATADEGIHLFAGAEYVENGTNGRTSSTPP